MYKIEHFPSASCIIAQVYVGMNLRVVPGTSRAGNDWEQLREQLKCMLAKLLWELIGNDSEGLGNSSLSAEPTHTCNVWAPADQLSDGFCIHGVTENRLLRRRYGPVILLPHPNRSRTMTDALHSFSNAESGMTAFVVANTKAGFNVTVRDDDSGLFVPRAVVAIPTEAQAVAIAQKAVA